MADVVRRPFERAVWGIERAAWATERVLLWPLRERIARHSLPGHSIGAAALVTIAVGAVLAGALLLPGDGDAPSEPLAAPARPAVAAVEPPAQEEPAGRELQGVPPSFGTDGGSETSDAGAELNAGSTDEPVLSTAATPPADESAGATSSSKKSVPAGPAAMKVARRFSEAFVFYEIGERPVRAKTVFAETAAPQLAEALDERPPRQPAESEVPKARVVNLVPGPRAGKAYTVSVSLLRVGLTSELRLELNKQKGQWLVTDVRG